jgi:dTDP-3-amino-3,4,6-trideoxy-alpha-D-glucose transaminase
MPAEIAYFTFARLPDDVRAQWLSAHQRVLADGHFIGGPEVAAFEREFAAYCDIQSCVGVGNGLDAITLALRALGIGPGHRVAVPGHTFIATWLAVLAVGATPVGVDVDARGLLDLADLAALSPVPDAVIPVHLHGQLVDIPAVMTWAGPRGVIVVEDCAQAHGAVGTGGADRVDGADWRMGGLTHAAAFSFYPSKNLGAIGDAGAIVTCLEPVAQAARALRSYGASGDDKYEHVLLGVNSRLDPVQAAVLRVNLGHLDSWNARRREIASVYLAALADSSGAVAPLVGSAESSVWHHFVVLTDDRDAFRAEALRVGIHTDVHYPRMAADEIAALTGTPAPSLPVSARLARTVMSIPLHPWLTDDEVSRVAELLERA